MRTSQNGYIILTESLINYTIASFCPKLSQRTPSEYMPVETCILKSGEHLVSLSFFL